MADSNSTGQLPAFPIPVLLDPDWPVVDLARRLTAGGLRLRNDADGQLTLVPVPHDGVDQFLLLRQALLLLHDADEANHSGDYGTFALQAQARECLAEAIDEVAP